MTKSDKCEGIVLGGFSFGESNKILKVLTKELGVIKVVANGIRKTSSRYSGLMELMNIISIVARKSKSSDLYTVREVDLVKSLHILRDKYDIISNLYYISEFIISFFENDLPNIEIYENLFCFLTNLENNVESVDELRWAFLIKCLSLLGYIPQLEYCSNCGEKLSKNVYVSTREGWIFCSNCMEYKLDKKISYGTINFLNFSLKNDYKDIVKIKVTEEIKKDVEEFFKYVIYGILGKELKSGKMFYTLS